MLCMASDPHSMLASFSPSSQSSNKLPMNQGASEQVNSARLQRVQHHGADRPAGQHQSPEGRAWALLPCNTADCCGYCGAWGYWRHPPGAAATASTGEFFALSLVGCAAAKVDHVFCASAHAGRVRGEQLEVFVQLLGEIGRCMANWSAVLRGAGVLVSSACWMFWSAFMGQAAPYLGCTVTCVLTKTSVCLRH